MKILIIGMGLMGPTIAKDCANDPTVDTVTGVDIDESKLSSSINYVDNKKFRTLKVDITDHLKLVEALTGQSVVVNCSSASMSMRVLKAAKEAHTNLIDLAGGGYPQEGEIYKEVESAGVTAIPGCGVDPGLIDVLCGHGMAMMDKVDEVQFACGGLPKDPKPPLDYKIVFGGRRMPIRPGKVPNIVNGELKDVDRYTDVESVFVDGHPNMEAFVDGYPSSLLKLCLESRVNKFSGKTIRYDGFVEKLKFLIDLGVVSDKAFSYGDREIIPLDFFNELVYPLIKFDDKAGDRDITVLLARISGSTNDIDIDVTYDMLDEYDEENGVTSMAKTTGFTAAIIARMLGRGSIKEKGIVWPVHAIKENLFDELLEELRKRGVEITETVTKSRNY